MKKFLKILSAVFAFCIVLSACGTNADAPKAIDSNAENEDDTLKTPTLDNTDPAEIEKEMVETLKNSDVEPQTLNMLEASGFYRPLGRTVLLGTSLTCDWTAAGAEFKILCKGDVSLSVTAANSTTTFTIVIDDVVSEKYFLVNKGSGTYTVAKDLEAGFHTIKILGEKGYGN
ncbi:MAG: hypothetical protein IJW79_00650, partial [Clostridia bacterium]|nr:hypothetical protein [Clostridia bacterium]